MLRGAIIGLGRAALDAHVPGWRRRDDVEIVAVTDQMPEPRDAVLAQLPDARWHDSVESLLGGERLDFVDICTTPSSHAALVSTALLAGLHVICEKPLVCSTDELATVAELAASTGRVLRTVHNWHHAPIIRHATALVRDGAIGRVARIAWRTLRAGAARGRGGRESDWRLDPGLAGGGILTDHGWHVFYLLHRWIGERPASVRAQLESRRFALGVVEDTASVEVTYPSATAEIFLTWAADRRETGVVLTGNGSLEIADDTLVLSAGGHEQRWSGFAALSSGSVHPDWFDPEVAQFLGEVRGTHGPDSNRVEASICATLEAAARESSRCGGAPIGVPPMWSASGTLASGNP
jgi:predicted dehydrogenase